jgi:hypothetical protein
MLVQHRFRIGSWCPPGWFPVLGGAEEAEGVESQCMGIVEVGVSHGLVVLFAPPTSHGLDEYSIEKKGKMQYADLLI